MLNNEYLTHFKLIIIITNVINYSTFNLCTKTSKNVTNINSIKVIALKFIHFSAKCFIFSHCLFLTYIKLTEELNIDEVLLLIDFFTYNVIIFDTLFMPHKLSHYDKILFILSETNQKISKLNIELSIKNGAGCNTRLISLILLVLTLKCSIMITSDLITYYDLYKEDPSEFIFYFVGNNLVMFNQLLLLVFELDVSKKLKFVNYYLKSVITTRISEDNLNVLEEVYVNVFKVQRHLQGMFGVFLLSKWLIAFNSTLSYPYYYLYDESSTSGFFWLLACFADILAHLLIVELINNQVKIIYSVENCFNIN